MSRLPLVQRSYLDPRPVPEAADRPIVDAVNIPLDELPGRTHELPPLSDRIQVVGPASLAHETVVWLSTRRRLAVVVPEFAHEPAEPPPSRGRLWRPTEFLAEVAAKLPPGTALDVGCGTGRDAVHLASLGWHVTGVDVLPDALGRARQLAARYEKSIEPIRWVQADVESADLSALGQFDAVLMLRYLSRAVLGRLGSLLRPGGSAIVETFTEVHRQRHGRPARNADVLAAGELKRLLAGLEMRRYSEDWHGEIHTTRAWATKA